MTKQNKSLDKILSLTDGYYFIYVPSLATALESVNAAIMLSYLVHWRGKGWLADNWVYKTITEMREGTGLTRDQQDSAIKVLRQHGFVEVQRRGTHGKRHYRVNIDTIAEKLESLWKSSKHYHEPLRKTRKHDEGNPFVMSFENQQTITEETHKQTDIINASSPAGLVTLPEILDDSDDGIAII